MPRIDYAVRARELAAAVPPEGWAADSLHRVHGLDAGATARRLRISRPRCIELLADAAAAYEASTDYLAARVGRQDVRERKKDPKDIVALLNRVPSDHQPRMRRKTADATPEPPRPRRARA